jgi:hypothetical protein
MQGVMKGISRVLMLDAIVLEDNGVHDGSEDTGKYATVGA